MRTVIHPADLEGARNGIRRSGDWPRAERIHRLLQPRCVCCTPAMSPNAAVQVHHVIPFHYCVALGRPDLELDQRNLVSLCENEAGKPGQNHHLLVGHLDSFESANLDAVHAAEKTFHGMIGLEIRRSPTWMRLVSLRLKPLGQMTEREKHEFAKEMNAMLPRRYSSAG